MAASPDRSEKQMGPLVSRLVEVLGCLMMSGQAPSGDPMETA